MASDLTHEVQTPADRTRDSYVSALSLLSDPTFVLDSEGKIRFVSDSVFPAFGWQPNELIGEVVGCLFRTADAKLLSQRIANLPSKHGGNGFEKTLLEIEARRKNGTSYPCEITISHGDVEEIGRVLTLVIRDISAAKIREKQTDLGRTLFTAGPVALFHWTMKEGWPVEFVSQNVNQLLGYSARDFISGQVPYCDVIHPDDRGRLIEKMEKSREEGVQRLEQDYRVVRADGVVRWFYDFTIISSGEEGPPRCVGYVLDITDIKLNEERLRDYSDALEEANSSLVAAKAQAVAATKAKSAFLANMSHEIRTPMTAILGYTDMLTELLDGKPGSEMLKIIRGNGEYLLELINDILDLAKIEAGKLVLSITRVNPIEVVEQVLRLMQVRAQEKNIKFTGELHGKIPETIAGDATRLRQILINIIGNAIKFTDNGFVKISVRLSSPKEARPMIHFEIEDSGIGMDAESVTRLFQPFVQVDTSSTRAFGGTGLGLSITKRLTRMMSGSISVRSIEGKGSQFTVSIAAGSLTGIPMRDFSPYRLVDLVKENTTVTNPPSWPRSIVEKVNDSLTQASEVSPMKDIKILLAEDNATNRKLIRMILQSVGAVVTDVENGQEAYEAAQAAARAGNPFDVILMDIQMPVLDGLTATRKLRDEGYQGVVIALTAHAMESDKKRCLHAGCDGYCTKPINREQLFSEITDRLEAARV